MKIWELWLQKKCPPVSLKVSHGGKFRYSTSRCWYSFSTLQRLIKKGSTRKSSAEPYPPHQRLPTGGGDIIPEPSTCALFGLGALALIVAYRRKAA